MTEKKEWKSFYELYGSFLSKFFFSSFLISFFLFGGLVYFFGNNTQKSVLESTLILLSFGLIISGFITLFIALLAQWKIIAKKKVFKKAPFTELHTLGFEPFNLNENSNWSLTEQTLAGWFNDYFFVCNTPRNAVFGLVGRHFIIKAFAKPTVPIYIRPLQKRYAKQGVQIRYGGVMKIYHTNKRWPKSIDSVKNDIETITELLHQLKAEPITDISEITWKVD